MYKIGDKVKVSSETDNSNYDLFREKILIVENIATYDSSMNGMQLMDFTTEEGDEIPFSLYEYEINHA